MIIKSEVEKKQTFNNVQHNLSDLSEVKKFKSLDKASGFTEKILRKLGVVLYRYKYRVFARPVQKMS